MSATGLPEYLVETAARLQASLRKEVIASGFRMERAARTNLTGAILHVRTGHLRRSVQSIVNGSDDGWEVKLRAGGEGAEDVRYAAIHEYGGTIRPINAKFLAIPKGKALTASGVSRYKTPRDVPGLRFVLIRGGRSALLVKDYPGSKSGKGARSEIWYQLVRSVRMPARPYLRPAMQAEEPVLAARLQQILHDALEAR